MGEYCPGQITIGGKLPKSKIPELAEAIDAEGVGFDWNEKDANAEAIVALLARPDFDGKLDLYDARASYGTFEDLETSLRELGLAYNRHSDAVAEAEAETVYWKPGMDEPEELNADNEGHLMVPVEAIREALDGDLDGLHGRIEALLAPYDDAIPALEIVADQ
jgi:hypothetical protein